MLLKLGVLRRLQYFASFTSVCILLPSFVSPIFKWILFDDLMNCSLWLWQNMTKDETTYSDLLNEVFAAHANLQGLPAARAELQYIKDVQLMDSYGCDFYVAKVCMLPQCVCLGMGVGLWTSDVLVSEHLPNANTLTFVTGISIGMFLWWGHQTCSICIFLGFACTISFDS